MSAALLAAIALSSLIGLSLGLLGGGGSILAVPVLVYVAGLAPHEAVPMSLAVVGATSLVAGVLHHGSGRVSLKAAALFGASGMGGAFFGSRLTHLVSGATLLLLFAVLMLLVGAWMLAPFAQRRVAAAEAEGRPPRLLLTVIAGVGVGVLTGFLGVGGGFLVVPALVFFARLGIKEAVGTSLYVIAANSLAGFAGHLAEMPPRAGLTVAFIAAAVAGAVAGHALARRTHPQRLRRAFGWFVVAVGAVVALQSARARYVKENPGETHARPSGSKKVMEPQRNAQVVPMHPNAAELTEEQVRQWVRSELAALNANGRLEQLEAEVKRLGPRTVSNKATLVVFSGDMDKVLAGLVIATGAAAMGLEVSMFHTFWGLNPLRKNPTGEGKDFIEKMMGAMMPAGLDGMSPSQMSFAGLGARLFRHRMKKNGVQSAQEFFELARELGVKFIACQMSMEVMGIRAEELVEGIEVGGVAAYLGEAADSRVTLFI